ncbi:DNA starvation/stationary phase protection protein [Mycoplasmatota bacterium zrk1]
MFNNDNLISRLDQYVMDMAALNVKLHNLHWNVVGPFFGDIHKRTQAYYEQAELMYDQIAERMKMLNTYPETLLSEYAKQTKIKEMESRDYKGTEVIEYIINDFKYLLDSARKILILANNINDPTTASLFSDYIDFYEKELWMLTSLLK